VRWCALLVLLVSCKHDMKEFARDYLTRSGYTVKQIDEPVEATVGPQRCQFGYIPFTAVVSRLPTPEEHCYLGIGAFVLVCCKPDRCYYRETSRWCLRSNE
jgi:hypothetical protein